MFTRGVTITLLLFLLPGPYASRSAAGGSPLPATVLPSSAATMSNETRTAVERALIWLASRQQADGAFGSGNTYGRNAAVTALCGMAFLSAGHTPGRGPYGEHVTRVVDFLLNACQPNGYIIVPDSTSHGPMYGHGFATLFLAEVYGMDNRAEVGERLRKAVRLIVSAQNEEGGWRYDPEPREADISVTVCQMMALRAARDAGVHVPKQTVDRCIHYVKSCQNPDGGFRYQLNRSPESLFPRSAAAVVALQSAGIYEGVEVENGLAYLQRYRPREDMVAREANFLYGHYYAVQANYHAGGNAWNTWYPAVCDALLPHQQPDGSWLDQSICNEYATAMTCLILQMPESHLPIFQR